MIKGESNITTAMNNLAKRKLPFLFVVDFEGEHGFVEALDDCKKKDILFKVNTLRNFKPIQKTNKKFKFKKSPIPFEVYLKGFQIVQKGLSKGDSYLINLTYPTPIETDLTLKEIFYRSTAKYKLYFKNKFVVFSPETFVKIKNQKIYSYPMKGTIDASIPDAYQTLKNSYKEIAEHNTIVDLIRNDLSMVSKKVRLEKFRMIEKIRAHDTQLYTVSSKISGNLAAGFENKIGSLLFDMLPAGSVTGAPKKKTVEIMKEAEGYDRGFYTGIFGIFDGYNLQSSVMIRFIENIDGKMIFKSGGGITALSDAKTEYQEMIDKVYLPIKS